MERKLDNLAGTGAAVVASGCPGCQMQLNTGIRRRRLPIRVVHPVTLLDEAYEDSRD
jgi:glycolate oxidase iron-sulfur subunit